MNRVPIIPTIFVVAAAAVMVALGIWQLGRADEKAALLAAYKQAERSAELVDFPVSGDGKDVWFRRSTFNCQRVITIETVAGTSKNGQKGWASRAQCVDGAFGEPYPVDIGFSRTLAVPDWQGGEVLGVIAPGPRLVADPPIAGLEPLAKPDPSDLPNNHLAYAGQWFFFALTALLIYGFALRSRWRKRG